MSNTCEWIRTYNKPHTPSEFDASQDSQPKREQASTDRDDKSKVARSLALSRPLARVFALACNENPTKVLGSEKFLPALQIMIYGYTKADPPTQKKLPVEADVLELIIEMGYGTSGSIQLQAVGDLSLIAFYYLLRIGEYTVKRQRERSKRAKKQTVQFKMEDVTFFKTDKNGILRCLPCNAPHPLIRTAESATLKLDNQKKRLERGLRSPRG